MRLLSVKLNDFQSYRTVQQTTLGPDVTLLAGRNNVGKTALLRALRSPTDVQPGWGQNGLLELTWSLSSAELTPAVPLSSASVFAASLDRMSTDGVCELYVQLHKAGPTQ